MFKYKNYIAKVEVDTESDMLYGRVLNIGDETARDIITFEGRTVREAEQKFQRAVDTYIEFCKTQGIEPNKPFSGKLPFRTTPEIHRDIYIAATRANKSINAWMEETLSQAAKQAENPIHSSTERQQEFEISFAEYGRLLTDLRNKIMRLKTIIEPYLQEKTTSTFARLYGELKPVLKDKELADLLEKVETAQEYLKSVQSQQAALFALTEQSVNPASSLTTVDLDGGIDLEDAERNTEKDVKTLSVQSGNG
ncbi:toxin-antitoxin system HicB family antitoxin [Leptolyngbya sp. NK1-12]|uniref:Toxin-antitoxin system HicB family antitoxin n=1 Tax=Leptolyngbya sp. NK1-12 TaxID=2547451 RepID=A0AA97AL27_9CYAN|nr:type II toxin-antitoxin system HicB family antitoxin [Leptolyngbya sp. NK1-12]WNZ24197.1 toxin-antitoxin system HicB family antitoxin [Leptolyngbya sp. NK1-12]